MATHSLPSAAGATSVAASLSAMMARALTTALVVALATLPAVAFAGQPTGAVAEPACAELKAPAGARVQSVADDMALNGQRARITRIDQGGSADALLGHYRARLGPRRVENAVAGGRIIAAEAGGCFVTVRIAAGIDGLAHATSIATRIGGERSHSKVERDTETLLPPGSAVLQTQESDDHGHPSMVLVAANRHGLQANRDALADQFVARGFSVVRDDPPSPNAPTVRLLQLASASEDATVAITDAGAYRSVVIQRNRRAP